MIILGINNIYRYYKTNDKLYNLRQEIEDLVELGPDYAHFMNASISYKSLKQIQKLLRKVG